MLIQSFEDSDAWRQAHALTLGGYRVTSNYPKSETYGLTSQLRRCAASVAANLAEGYGRHSKNELRRFSQIANGSLQETIYFLILSKDLGYLPEEDYDALMSIARRTGKLLGGIERSTRSTRTKQPNKPTANSSRLTA